MRTRLLVSLVALTLAAPGRPGRAADRFSHDGVTIDAATGQALGSVTAKAYAVKNRQGPGDCPTYQEFLDDDVSRADGTFRLQIPTDKPSYVVTYCNPTYATFTATANDNLNDAPITPIPIRMYRRDGALPDMVNALALLEQDTQEALTLLRERDKKKYEQGVQTLQGPERTLLGQWNERSTFLQRDPTSQRAHRHAAFRVPERVTVPTIVRGFRQTLDYLHATNAAHFREALAKFDSLQAYAQETIIKKN